MRSRLFPSMTRTLGLRCANGATLLACNAASSAARITHTDRDFCPARGTNSPPALTRGASRWTADQGGATIPVTLTVWNFETHVQPFRAFPMVALSARNRQAPMPTEACGAPLTRNKVWYWVDWRRTPPVRTSEFWSESFRGEDTTMSAFSVAAT